MDVPRLLKTEDRTTIERWVESRSCSAYLGGNRVLARVLGRYLMNLPTDDFSLVPHLVMDGYWEMWITMAVARHIREGMRCIDVGANVGYYTMLLADLVGESGKIEAWEPQVDLAQCVVMSAHMSGFYNRVSVVPCAASNKSSTVKTVPLDMPWARGSVGVVPAGVEEDGAVPCERLDEERPWYSGQPVDFVKIDAEGHEPQVWEGMAGILEHSPGIQILMEFTPRTYEDAPGFLDQIRQDGFVLRKVDFDGDLQAAHPDQILGTESMEMLWLSR
jgi:FkbM family methyltransferase